MKAAVPPTIQPRPRPLHDDRLSLVLSLDDGLVHHANRSERETEEDRRGRGQQLKVYSSSAVKETYRKTLKKKLQL